MNSLWIEMANEFKLLLLLRLVHCFPVDVLFMVALEAKDVNCIWIVYGYYNLGVYFVNRSN